MTEKEPPSGLGQNVFYSYDLLDRLTSADFGSVGGAGVAYGYDALSRRTSETAGGYTLASQYDAAGDRTQITWPDNFYVDYVYDALQRPTQVEERGATSGVGLLAVYTYDSLGRLSAIARGNGAGTSLGYNGADLVSTLTHDFTNAASDITWSFTYDAANGVLSRAASSDLYSSLPGTQNQSYVANGLGQYASVSGTGFSYDSRGNLTSDGTRAFTYDVDNKLLTGSAPTAAAFTYDPLGRMQTDTASGATTTFLYDGQNLAAEYDSSGTVLRRYAPSGLGIDQPLVWYEGSGTSSRRWLHADNQGSIAAYSDSSGDADAAYGYDPYGAPTTWSGSRYSYTGQLMIPENSLYNYKARVYDPIFGRFLSADPSGLGSDMNLYAYANGGPTNFGDPTGRLSACFECVAPVTVVGVRPDTYADAVDLVGGTEPENLTTPNTNAASIDVDQVNSQPLCPALADKRNAAADTLENASLEASVGAVVLKGFGVAAGNTQEYLQGVHLGNFADALSHAAFALHAAATSMNGNISPALNQLESAIVTAEAPGALATGEGEAQILGAANEAYLNAVAALTSPSRCPAR